MATLLEESNGWHPGERAVHALLKVPTSNHPNPTNTGLPAPHAYRVTLSPLVAIGTLDEQGRPWTTIWGGEAGFARPVARGVLAMQSLVDKDHDPVIEALLGRAAKGEVVRPGEDKLMSALSIDLETRDRVKLAGKMVVGTVSGHPDSDTIHETQVAMLVQEALGNCPKYINKKTVRGHVPTPQLVSSSLPLPQEALDLIAKADMFFLSSTNGQTMDTNHRGGPPGFVRVLSNLPHEGEGAGNGVVLVYPEYSGNRLYQSLGNLYTNPRVGIVIPDYETSDVLYLTGATELLVGPTAAATIPHTNLAIKITVQDARFVRDGLPFRGEPGEPSPYNPPVRRLASECPSSLHQPLTPPLATAILVRKEPLTPNIARFTFRLRPSSADQPPRLKPWLAGQHITLSFAHELDMGWHHMDDADPQSLNDDFIRTFTISSPPPPPAPPPAADPSAAGGQVEIQLTLRRHGPATNLLFSHRLGATAAPLEIPVLAIVGEEAFRIPIPVPVPSGEGNNNNNNNSGGGGKKAVFVAGGIGITPLLAQAPGLLATTTTEGGRDAALTVLWSLRAADLPLAVDAFEKLQGLKEVARVFVTGTTGAGDGRDCKGDDGKEEVVGKLRKLGVQVEVRRMGREDVLGARDAARGTKYFVCAGAEMREAALAWLGGEEVVFESFEY
ncbi:hypothetical protein VTK56DRAFT_10003 [Thermocarpiscus australiensis]